MHHKVAAITEVHLDVLSCISAEESVPSSVLHTGFLHIFH